MASAADTTIGSTFATTNACTGPYTLLQTGSVAPSYAAPGKGVITSIRMTGSTADTSREYKVARPNTTGGYSIIASGASTVIPANQTSTTAVRVPVQTGDVLGEYVPAVTTTCVNTSTSSGDVVTIYATNDIGVGGTATGGNPQSGYRLSVAATVEPDANGDGYGDTTQEIGTLGAPRGRAKVGKQLAAPTVTNLPTVATVTYQWYRLVTFRRHGHVHHVYRPIAAAHGSHYRLRSVDQGKRVKVRITVTATNYNPAPSYSPSRRVR